MLCEEIMKTDIESASPNDTVQAAAKRMHDENVGFLPVCDESKKAVGTITDRDLALRVLGNGRPASTRVEEVMTREVVSCGPSDDLRHAEELMVGHHKSRIMCVEKTGRLVGVISLSDIAQREEATETAQTMRGITERETRI